MSEGPNDDLNVGDVLKEASRIFSRGNAQWRRKQHELNALRNETETRERRRQPTVPILRPKLNIALGSAAALTILPFGAIGLFTDVVIFGGWQLAHIPFPQLEPWSLMLLDGAIPAFGVYRLLRTTALDLKRR